MKLYTIQHPYLLDEMKTIGKLISHKEYEMFPDEYTWMKKQMKTRLNICNPSDSIIWLWEDKPDLRRGGYGARGTEMILLEVDLEEKYVLCSDFDTWHFVLNDIEFTKYEDEQIEKEESWNRIFDLDFCKSMWNGSKQYLQYVTGEIPSDRIKFIRKFKCK